LTAPRPEITDICPPPGPGLFPRRASGPITDELRQPGANAHSSRCSSFHSLISAPVRNSSPQSSQIISLPSSAAQLLRCLDQGQPVRSFGGPGAVAALVRRTPPPPV